MLIFIRDLGSSLMYFGGFLALLYVATNRPSFVLFGLILFGLGAWFMGTHVPHVHDRVDVWLDPFNPRWVQGSGYQIAQSMFAQADGGLFGTGFGASLLTVGHTTLIPAPQTDLIYAVIVNELGLVGACGLILVYLLFAERGFKTAMLASDSFSKLLAVGLSSVFALQVFVIVGGVTRVIPLTGVTLPFVSYGGSSIMANFILLALLLIVSDKARRPAAGSNGRRAPVNKPVGRLFVLVVVLFAVLVGFTSRWTVFDAQALRENPANHRILLQEERIKRGVIRAADGTALAVLAPDRAGPLRAPLPDRTTSSPTRSASSRSTAGASASRTPTTTRCRAARRRRSARSRGCSARRTRATTSRRRSRRPARRRPTRGSTAARARSSRSTSTRGAVRVMAATPSYDPNDPKNASTFNRATQGRYPPGSTFKTVTAAAALDSGRFTPSSTLDGRSPQTISGAPLSNFGGEQFGQVDLTTALTQLDQHGLGAGRRQARQGADGRLHAQVRLLRGPADGLPGPPDAPQRRVPQRQAAAAGLAVHRRRPHGDRAGQAAGHAAADGDGGADDRQRRRAHGAADRRAGHRPRRAHGRRIRSARWPSA